MTLPTLRPCRLFLHPRGDGRQTRRSSPEKARKRRGLALKASVGAGLAADRWRGVVDAVGVPAAATQGVQGRLCRKPAAVLAARSCARPLGRGAGGRPRSREVASCRWPYAPRERTDREAPYLGGAWRVSAVSRDGRPLRLKRWRAAHVAGIFRPSAGRPGNNRAVHRPEARHSSSAAWRSLALGLRAVFAHAPQFWTCNL